MQINSLNINHHYTNQRSSIGWKWVNDLSLIYLLSSLCECI